MRIKAGIFARVDETQGLPSGWHRVLAVSTDQDVLIVECEDGVEFRKGAVQGRRFRDVVEAPPGTRACGLYRHDVVAFRDSPPTGGVA